MRQMMGEFLVFLKILAYGSGAMVSFQIVSDFLQSETWKKIQERRGLRVKKIKAFPFGNEHTTVLGITQHGKTYATMQTLEKLNESVFFFNPQDERTPNNFIYADGNNSFDEIKNALIAGKKINYVPSDDLTKASKELEHIVNKIYAIGSLKVRFCVDEVHLLSYDKSKRGLKACQRIATTGLKRGIKGVWITQRGALLDNTLLNQSTRHFLFALGNQDLNYLKTNGFPSEEIKALASEKYRFVEYDQKEVKGAYMIG